MWSFFLALLDHGFWMDLLFRLPPVVGLPVLLAVGGLTIHTAWRAPVADSVAALLCFLLLCFPVPIPFDALLLGAWVVVALPPLVQRGSRPAT